MFSYLREFVIVDVETLGYIQKEDKTLCLVRFDAIKIDNGKIIDRIRVFGHKNKIKREFENNIEKKNNIKEIEKALETPIQEALNKVYDFVSDKIVVMWDNIMYDYAFDIQTSIQDEIKDCKLCFKDNKQIFIQGQIEDCDMLEDFDGYLGLFDDVAEYLGIECNGRDGTDIIYDIMKKLSD